MAEIPRRWLTKEEQALWRAYLNAQFRLTKYLQADVVKNSGFDSLTYEIFVHLSESPERSLRMNTLAKRTSVSKTKLTYRINHLEKQGLVKRLEVPEDKRGQLCQLTDEGYEVLKKAAPFHVEAVLTQFIDKIEPQDYKKLTSIFNSVAIEAKTDLFEQE